MAPLNVSGEVVALDWNTKEILARAPVIPEDPTPRDPNPRGGARGGRGIVTTSRHVIVSSYHSLYRYDQDLRFQSKFSHSLMAGLHESFLDEDAGLWVTSTAIDAALKFDLADGRLVDETWPHEMSSFQKGLGLTPLDIDKHADNRLRYLPSEQQNQGPSHLHLNAVARWNGNMFALFHGQGVVVNLDTGEVVLESERICKGHNLIIQPDGTAIVIDSRGRKICFFNFRTGNLNGTINLMDYPEMVGLVRRWEEFRYNFRAYLQKVRLGRFLPAAKPLFLRGMAIDGEKLFVGVSPATIVCFNWATGVYLDQYSYSLDVCAAIHGLSLVP